MTSTDNPRDKAYDVTDNFVKEDLRSHELVNLSDRLSPLEFAFSSLFVWYEGEQAGWRVRKRYRDLFACLTPRQIKSFLRERLLAATGNGESADPVVAMLKTLFHPVWRLRREENGAFRALGHVAKAALKLSKESRNRGDEQGKLSGPAADLFFQQLQAMASTSSVLTDDDVRACWPRQNEERALLLNLLDLATGVEEEEKEKEKEKEKEEGFFDDRKRFPDWVRQRLGAQPNGVSVAEQVSSFQDMVLARHREGDSAVLPVVAEYADSFLDRHMGFFDASTAPSLSNLAVLIDDVSGSEAQCDRLFQAAVKLAKRDSPIPFYYTEFLLNTQGDPARRERLPSGGDEAINRARTILDAIQDEDVEANDRIYRDFLIYRLQAKPNNDRESTMPEIWALAKRHAGALASGERGPSSRLNDLLDAVIGKGGAAMNIKEPLQGMIWAVQVKARNPGAMAIQIANDLVGESAASSNEEKTGLSMNAALVVTPGLEASWLAAVWSQTGELLFQRNRAAAKSRIALAFLVSLAYGGGGQSFKRMQRVWGDLVRDDNQWRTPASWTKLLDEAHQPLADAITKQAPNMESLESVRDAVFLPDYPPIATPDALVEALGWKNETFAWAGGKSFDEAVNELLDEVKDDGN